MSSNPNRKAELELKKEKLRALREEKLRREQNKRDGHNENNGGTDSDLRGEADAILKNLGIAPLKDPDEEDATSKLHKDGIVPNDFKLRSSSNRRKKLQYCQVSEFCIKPHSSDSYTKETQTIDQQPSNDTLAMDYYVLTYEESPLDQDRPLPSPFGKQDQIDAKMLKSVNGEIPKQTPSTAKEELKEPALVELTEEQKQQMMLSEGFRHFFDRSARIIERALCEHDDEIFQDYSGADLRVEKSDELTFLCRDFFDDHWSRNRSVTDLDWSHTYPELLLAAYSPNEEVLHEPAGCCMIWNLKFPSKKSPEYILHASEPITAACLSQFHPNLVVGGTYAGQLVLWDTRSNKRTPVQRSTFAASAHTQPVSSVQVIGSQNAHNIISMSTDGSMCAWSMDMLGQPREKTKFCETPPSSMFDLYPTCMAFFANDQNNFVIGSESGTIYTNQRHSSRVTSAGDAQGNRPHPFKGHSALVTSVSTHPSPTAVNFSQFFLSASLDWTVRLWSTRESNAPLHIFDDYSECVYGVEWSPVHPALFAAVDGMGRIDVWNLNNDVEVPTARCQLAGGGDSGAYPAAINKVKWDLTGQFIAAGDDEGHVRLCSVAESLAIPSNDDSTNLVHILANLKCSQQAS